MFVCACGAEFMCKRNFLIHKRESPDSYSRPSKHLLVDSIIASLAERGSSRENKKEQRS